MYRRWLPHLPASADLYACQLPGREERLAEPHVTCWETLVSRCRDDCMTLGNVPLILFGHSMGGLIAYEVATALESADHSPHHLVISAAHAPHQDTAEHQFRAKSDAQLAAALQRNGGLPQSVLNSPAFLDLFLPIIRADLSLYESYSRRSHRPLGCPISVVGGLSDAVVAYQQLKEWRTYTRRTFALRVFEGGHFMIQQTPQAAIATILHDCSAAA